MDGGYRGRGEVYSARQGQWAHGTAKAHTFARLVFCQLRCLRHDESAGFCISGVFRIATWHCYCMQAPCLGPLRCTSAQAVPLHQPLRLQTHQSNPPSEGITIIAPTSMAPAVPLRFSLSRFSLSPSPDPHLCPSPPIFSAAYFPKDLSTGAEVMEPLPGTSGDVEWAADNVRQDT